MADQVRRPTVAQLCDQFWANFHHVWGLAKDGRYNRQAWNDLHRATLDLFESAGVDVERCQRQRDDANC